MLLYVRFGEELSKSCFFLIISSLTTKNVSAELVSLLERDNLREKITSVFQK